MRPLICGFADLQQINVLLTMQRNWDTKLAKFVICRGINHFKIIRLFAKWHTSEISGFATATVDFATATVNETDNLRFCGLKINVVLAMQSKARAGASFKKVKKYSIYTVKKTFRYSRPQPGCHLPTSPWAGIMTSSINYSCPGRDW